jgi:hypothetical protein
MIRDVSLSVNDLLELLEKAVDLRIKSIRWKPGKDLVPMITFEDNKNYDGEFYFDWDGDFMCSPSGTCYYDLSVAKLYGNAHPNQEVLGVVLNNANDAYYIKVREDVQKIRSRTVTHCT